MIINTQMISTLALKTRDMWHCTIDTEVGDLGLVSSRPLCPPNSNGNIGSARRHLQFPLESGGRNNLHGN